ncbi:GNAT family N-acetyltransferase [Vibrio intestinalis]|uniref:GNAT family N-acetyltransferase n=1 Tax=Vibrio intestinalis TaxID=2933291 RepID=UPI0021A4F053|nr:GNAT family protein [Vibrio intestinalis]
MEFPEYESTRLILRQLDDTDTSSILNLFSNEAVIAYYDMEAITKPSQAAMIIEQMRHRFITKAGIRWGIVLKETGNLIGTCGFNSWNEKMKSAVIGYDLLPQYWGQGIMAEAINKIVRQAFLGDLPCGKLNRIQADTVLGNVSSEKLLAKVGLKEEGLRRQSGYWKGQFHDLKCFGLLQSEYKEKGTFDV